MSFFGRSTAHAESVVVADISANSIVGACVRFAEGAQPHIVYEKRVPIVPHSGEAPAEAMYRALTLLCDTLVKEGGPALVRFCGSGSINHTVVSMGSPWQETWLRTENIEEEKPFVFTRSMIDSAIAKADEVPDGKERVDVSVLGTTLNGYETHRPIGKRAHRASIILLSSFIEEGLRARIQSIFAHAFHRRAVRIISSNSVRFQALRIAFPHESNALVVDASTATTSLALIRRGLLASVAEVSERADAVDAWRIGVGKALGDLATKYPLPHTIFLVAAAGTAEELQSILEKAHSSQLWFSENRPSIISLRPSMMFRWVRTVQDGAPDLTIMLMALYWEAIRGDTIIKKDLAAQEQGSGKPQKPSEPAS